MMVDSRYGMSDAEFEKHIRESAEVDAGINEFMENEGVPYGKSASPVESGKYAASWKVMKKAKNGKGVFGPTAWYSHFIEFGTGPDQKLKKSKSRNKIKKKSKKNTHTVEVGPDEFRELGPNTPTKALGVVQKVASHFGGDLKGGVVEVKEK